MSHVTNVDAGVSLERNHVLEDERYWINRYGEDVIFMFNVESNIVRDEYNSIKQKNTATPIPLTMKAYPVTYSPSQEVVEKAGISERVDVMIVTAMKDWTLSGKDIIKDLNIVKAEVLLRGETYTIKAKSQTGHVANTFTTITIGLNRK